jgi:hypothetical protein
MVREAALKLAIFIGPLAVAAPGAHAQDPARVESPEARLGDTRIYDVLEPRSRAVRRLEELVITEITDAQVQVTDKVSSTVTAYEKNWALKQVGARVYTQPVQALSFPLEVGKKWEHSNSYVHASCGLTTSTLKSEVVGWEDVTVPAGSFRALRIDSSGQWRNGCGGDRQSYRFWYAPAVKWVVRSETLVYAQGQIFDSQLRELRSFKVD